jgi:hypothetical protein
VFEGHRNLTDICSDKTFEDTEGNLLLCNSELWGAGPIAIQPNNPGSEDCTRWIGDDIKNRLRSKSCLNGGKILKYYCAEKRCNTSCGENGRCTKTHESYRCGCDIGFARATDSPNCADIDECSSEDDNQCDANSQCNNTVGSYICECDRGYSGNGINCSEINECLEKNICGVEPNECNNTNGSYKCICGQYYNLVENDPPMCKAKPILLPHNPHAPLPNSVTEKVWASTAAYRASICVMVAAIMWII